MTDKITTLDVRGMPPWERHPKIFETFDGLKIGETLKLVNDHNPNFIINLCMKGKGSLNGQVRKRDQWNG